MWILSVAFLLIKILCYLLFKPLYFCCFEIIGPWLTNSFDRVERDLDLPKGLHVANQINFHLPLLLVNRPLVILNNLRSPDITIRMVSDSALPVFLLVQAFLMLPMELRKDGTLLLAKDSRSSLANSSHPKCLLALLNNPNKDSNSNALAVLNLLSRQMCQSRPRSSRSVIRCLSNP